MKTKNTYSMLLQSEEKGRSIFESAVYGLVLLCVAFTGWQFASNSVVTPGMHRTNNGTSAEMATQPAAPAPVVLASR